MRNFLTTGLLRGGGYADPLVVEFSEVPVCDSVSSVQGFCAFNTKRRAFSVSEMMIVVIGIAIIAGMMVTTLKPDKNMLAYENSVMTLQNENLNVHPQGIISDRRLKHIQGEFSPDALDKIRQLTVYNYKYDEKKLYEMDRKEFERGLEHSYKQELSMRLNNSPAPEKARVQIAAELKKEFKNKKQEQLKNIARNAKEFSKRQFVGVMAQDLQKIYPNSVIKDEAGYLRIANRDELFYAMMNAVKTLDKNVQDLKKENEMLTKRLEQLEHK